MEEAYVTSRSIFSILKDEILNLTIQPGQQLSENEVCERFCVSRTPVRTAFQRLKDAGLLSVVPYKSTSATLLNFEQIEQSIYMRVAVETRVIRDLMQSVDAMTIEKIRYNLRQQEILISAPFDTEQFYEIDSALHGIWFHYLRKETLWKLIQRMQVNYTRFRMLDIVEVQNFRQIYEEHARLFDLICEKKIDQIESLIQQHLYGGIYRLGERMHTEFAHYFTPACPPESLHALY